MVTIARPQRLSLPTQLPSPPVLAGAAGGVVALGFLVMPGGLLERIVTASGIAAVIAAAEPPLGLTARLALGLLIGGAVAAFAWVALSTIADARAGEAGQGGLFRGGDVHPDAPPRPPLFANRDLGMPFLDVKAPAEAVPEAGRDLPRDLDQPMAAFDPAALLAIPLPAPEAIAPLRPVETETVDSAVFAPEPVAPRVPTALIDPGDRIETFELTPLARSHPLPLREPVIASPAPTVPTQPAPAVIGPETAATVHDLLARLEAKLAAPPPAPVSTLADTLGDLRRMATGAH